MPMLYQCRNLTCGGKGSERPYSSSFHRYHWFHPAHSDTFQQSPREWYTACYFFFPLFEMLGLAICHEGVCLRLSKLYTSNWMKSSTISCVCLSVVLLTLSHWLHDMFSYISNSVNLILINFSRAGYPGQFLQQCTMHLRLMVWQTAIAIKSLIMMSNFGTSTFLSSDLSAFFFNWFFTSEQKQSKSNLVFWWWYKNIQNKHQTTIWSRII